MVATFRDPLTPMCAGISLIFVGGILVLGKESRFEIALFYFAQTICFQFCSLWNIRVGAIVNFYKLEK